MRNVRAIGSFRVCGEQGIRCVLRHVAKGHQRRFRNVRVMEIL